MRMGDGTEVAAPIVHDAFPGRVISPEGRHLDQVRAVVTPSDLFVYGERTTQRGERAPVTLLRVPIDSMRPEGRTWVLVAADGGEWTVGPGSGCGCGSPLRSLPMPIPAVFPTDD